MSSSTLLEFHAPEVPIMSTKVRVVTSPAYEYISSAMCAYHVAPSHCERWLIKAGVHFPNLLDCFSATCWWHW